MKKSFPLILTLALALVAGGCQGTFKTKSSKSPREQTGVGPDKRPAGWDQGKKTGWDSDLPPGLAKKASPHRDKIIKRCRAKGHSQTLAEKIADIFVIGCKKGVTVDVCSDIVVLAVDEGLGESAIANAVDDLVGGASASSVKVKVRGQGKGKGKGQGKGKGKR